MAKKNFNEFRFSGFKANFEYSNKYIESNRISEDGNKIIVKIGQDHLVSTKYGYAVILNATHVVFVKNWQVDINYYGIEVILNKDYFNVKEWGDFSDNFADTEDFLSWDTWVKVAKQQEEAGNLVRWKK